MGEYGLDIGLILHWIFSCGFGVAEWNRNWVVFQCAFWIKSNILIYLIKNECFYNVLIQVFCVGRSIHYIRISATFKVNKVQGAKVNFPPSSIVLFFMLFLMRHQALNFIKKPLIYEVLINSESTNAFFSNLEGIRRGSSASTCHLISISMWSLAVPAPTIFNTKHMFPNPVVSFTYPQTLRMLWILQVRTYTHFESLFEGPMFSRPQ